MRLVAADPPRLVEFRFGVSGVGSDISSGLDSTKFMGHDVETAGEAIMISNRVIFALPIGAIFSALLWQPVVAQVVAPDAKWEQVASGGEGTAEGVVAARMG